MHIFSETRKNMVMVGVYVDDILIAGNNRALFNKVKVCIGYHFKIKDMGPVKPMLDININHNVTDGLLTMDQSKTIIKLVAKFQPYNNALINSLSGKELKVRAVETTSMIPGQVLSSKSDLPESDDMKNVPIRPRRTVKPNNRLTYDRLCSVLMKLSEAGIVSEYGAYNATNYKDMNLKLEDLCLNTMDTAIALYDNLLNADNPNNPNKAMNAIDLVEWCEPLQYKLDVLEEKGVWIVVPDDG
jgi:Reverse transcriptase (RNA-dependent DNA polymerase)